MVRRVPLNRGTGLFGDSEAETKPTAAAAWRANIDGGSRGNPGPASYGVVIRNPGCVAKTYPGFWQDLERLRT